MRYVAYAVDLSGIARAVYEINCSSDDDAQARAEQGLSRPPTARRVVMGLFATCDISAQLVSSYR
jgi:hypothetical protein